MAAGAVPPDAPIHFATDERCDLILDRVQFAARTFGLWQDSRCSDFEMPSKLTSGCGNENFSVLVSRWICYIEGGFCPWIAVTLRG